MGGSIALVQEVAFVRNGVEWCGLCLLELVGPFRVHRWGGGEDGDEWYASSWAAHGSRG